MVNELMSYLRLSIAASETVSDVLHSDEAKHARDSPFCRRAADEKWTASGDAATHLQEVIRL